MGTTYQPYPDDNDGTANGEPWGEWLRDAIDGLDDRLLRLGPTVMDFGAAGNSHHNNGGGTNDLPAFEAARDYAEATDGEIRYHGGHSYRLDGTLELDTTMKLRGIGNVGGDHNVMKPNLVWGAAGTGTLIRFTTAGVNLPGRAIVNTRLAGRNVGSRAVEYVGAKPDSGAYLENVDIAAWTGDGLHIDAEGLTNFWIRGGRWDAIAGYCIYTRTDQGVFLSIADITADIGVVNSKGFLFLDGEDVGVNNGKSQVGLHDCHIEVNGTGLLQTSIPTAWSPTGCDTRGVIRFGVDPDHPAVVQHLLTVDNLWLPVGSSVNPMSLFQITSADLTTDLRDRHARAVLIDGSFPAGVANGATSSENSVGAVKLIGGIKDADNYPYLPGSGTARQPQHFSFHPVNSQFVSGPELRLDYFGGRTQIRDLYVGNGKFFDADAARGAISMFNAATVPGANATGGGYLYAEGGALKWRGSSGTVTTIAPA